jgi:predicted RNA binding protein YcfA (HicA-like mRNA interferase family)
MPRMPGVNHLDAVRALEKAGFQIARQGKHIVMTDGTRVRDFLKPQPLMRTVVSGVPPLAV